MSLKSWKDIDDKLKVQIAKACLKVYTSPGTPHVDAYDIVTIRADCGEEMAVFAHRYSYSDYVFVSISGTGVYDDVCIEAGATRLTDIVEVLTNKVFDANTPDHAMLDFLEEQGHLPLLNTVKESVT